MADLIGELLQPAYDGIDSDSAPEAIAKTKAPLVENLLVHRPGLLPIRGPLNESLTLLGTAGPKITGCWSHNNTLLIGFKETSGGSIEPHAAPYRRAAADTDLAAADGTAYHVDLETNTATAVSPGAEQMPGARWTNLGASTWGYGYASATIDTVNGGKQYRTSLLEWDGTTTLPTVYTHAPRGAQDLRAHLDRLFVLGGTEPDTTVWNPNSLWWTDPGGPTADTLAMWQDDVSGLTNQIVVDSENVNDFGVALAKVGRNLAIFKRKSLHVLYGDAPENFALRPFTTEQGCLDPRSVLEFENGVFFMSDQGLMFFDGSRIINTTESLRTTALMEALRAVGDRGDNGGFVRCGHLPNGYISVSIGTAPSSDAATEVNFCGLFHVARGAWTLLSSDVLSPTRPVFIGQSLSRTFVIDDTKLMQANKLTAPETEEPAARGFDSDDELFTWDETGTGPIFDDAGGTLDDSNSPLTNQLTGVAMFPAAGTNTHPIPAKWYSRLLRLAEPFSRAQLQRVLLDYQFAVANSADDAHDGWYVSVWNGQGQQLVPEFRVPSQGDPSAFPYRRQQSTDAFAETNDAQLRVEWKGADPLALTSASIFNAAIQFRPTRQRPTG